MSDLKRRQNETASLLHRDKMELCPPGVNIKKWELFREKYNKASKLEINNAPIQLNIELTSDCNMTCSFCIHSKEPNKHINLGFSQYTKIIDEAAEIGVLSVKLNYLNEPLLVPDLERYIWYAKSKGIVNVFFASNGLLLTEARAKSLIESGLTKIFISLDATTKEMYSQLRNNKHFDLIISNIKGFLRVRNSLGLMFPLVRVNFLKTNKNKGQLNDFLATWGGVADMVIVQEMNELLGEKTELFIENTKKNYKCSFPFKQLVVTASGDILPCCTMSGGLHKLGNIKNMSLKDAWNSPKIRGLRTLHLRGDYKSNKICKFCIDGK